MNSSYLRKLAKRVIYLILCCLPICCIINLTGCVSPKQNVETTDIYGVFEEDYAMLQQVSEYTLQLINEQELRMIIIENSEDPITIDFGKELDIKNDKIRQNLKVLFDRGYIRISFYRNKLEDDIVIEFERFKKTMSHEYRSGYAYSPNAKGELNIQYIISQEELSVPDWYYYEEDYNEWRTRNN